MNALILLAVYIVTTLIFLCIALTIGLATDRFLASMSSLIFVLDVALAMGLAWPVALWLTRNLPDDAAPTR
jgi:hypothetical protein